MRHQIALPLRGRTYPNGKGTGEGNKHRKEEKGSCTVSACSSKSSLASSIVGLLGSSSSRPELVSHKKALRVSVNLHYCLSTHLPSVLWSHTLHQPTSAQIKSQADFLLISLLGHSPKKLSPTFKFLSLPRTTAILRNA